MTSFGYSPARTDIHELGKSTLVHRHRKVPAIDADSRLNLLIWWLEVPTAYPHDLRATSDRRHPSIAGLQHMPLFPPDGQVPWTLVSSRAFFSFKKIIRRCMSRWPARETARERDGAVFLEKVIPHRKKASHRIAVNTRQAHTLPTQTASVADRYIYALHNAESQHRRLSRPSHP